MSKPAFPHESPNKIFAGMSLLEYYAGQALSGFLANSSIDTSETTIAELSFDCAKAMMAESEKRKQ